MKFGAAEINGRERNPPSTEDRHFFKSLPGEITIAGVFDGHGGLATVVYTINNLPKMLENMILEVNGDVNAIQARLKDLFIQHDKNLASKGYIVYRDTGSTATIAIVTPTACIIAHIGDSPACVIDSTNGAILQKIYPHLPNQPKEKERIIRCKGTVTQEGGDAPRVNGSLMVSRAFGDFSLKFQDVEYAQPEMNKNWKTDFCVTSEPEILVFPRPQKGVLAIFSDGLVDTNTDTLKPLEEVGKMILDGINTSGGDYMKAAKTIVDKHVEDAGLPYTGDDTTLLLLDISVPYIGGSQTKKARRLRRLKKQTKRLSEGLKTIII
jgi:serine/threonine protein phosphatase PrpC